MQLLYRQVPEFIQSGIGEAAQQILIFRLSHKEEFSLTVTSRLLLSVPLLLLQSLMQLSFSLSLL